MTHSPARSVSSQIILVQCRLALIGAPVSYTTMCHALLRLTHRSYHFVPTQRVFMVVVIELNIYLQRAVPLPF